MSRGESDKFSDWIKKKQAVINPIDKKDKCFQYAVTVTLDLEKIREPAERITKIKLFISIYMKRNKFSIRKRC